jgi:hypothetical protein
MITSRRPLDRPARRVFRNARKPRAALCGRGLPVPDYSRRRRCVSAQGVGGVGEGDGEGLGRPSDGGMTAGFGLSDDECR